MKKEIVVAGGCFWGVQEYYRRLKGVEETRVGYAQGSLENPNYAQVKRQISGHAECVRIVYDSDQITLEQLLDHLFRIIDPTSLNRQGNDVGTSYRTGIYPACAGRRGDRAAVCEGAAEKLCPSDRDGGRTVSLLL